MRLPLITKTSLALLGSFIAVAIAWLAVPRLGWWRYDPGSVAHNAILLAAAAALFYGFVRLSLGIVERHIRQTVLLQSALYRISAEAGAAHSLGEFYATVHSIVAGLMDATNFYVAIHDPARRVCNFEYFVDEADQPVADLPDDQGLTGKVLQTRRPYLYSVDRRADQDKDVSRVGKPAVDWMGVPLLRGQRVYGVLAVQSYTKNVRYSDQHLKLLTFVSEHIVSILEQKRYETELRSMSLTDELTGLANRRGFQALAVQALKVADRSRQPSALFFADLDCMKEVNDNLGHQTGDQLLAALAGLLRDCFRESDILARIGGDEFVALAYDTDRERADLLCQRLLQTLDRSNQDGSLPAPAAVSVGVEIYRPGSGRAVEQLLEAADRRMYEQKNAKRRRPARGCGC